MRLLFRDLGSPGLRVGPFDRLHIADGVIRWQREPIAELDGRLWIHGFRRYHAVECDGPLWLHFEEPLVRGIYDFGVIRQVRIAGGMLFADDGVAATYLTTQGLWSAEGSGELWPIAVLADASAEENRR